jgi:ribosomal subunit interface protein
MKLNWSLSSKNMRPHSQLLERLRMKVKKLEKHLAHFPADAVHLQVKLQKELRKTWFTASLILNLPTGAMSAQKSAEDPVPAFDHAIKALLREIAGLKSTLRGKADWQRVMRSAVLASGASQTPFRAT